MPGRQGKVYPHSKAAEASLEEEDSDVEDGDEAADLDSNDADHPHNHQPQDLDLSALANDKRLKGKIRIAGVEEEAEVAMKDRRDQARKKEMEVRDS